MSATESATPGFDSWVASHACVASKPHSGIRLDDKMAMFQQLATLVCCGTPLLRALQICAVQSQSVKLKAVIEDICVKVSSGSSLYSAASAHPKVFERHWVEVIRTGEVTGQMGTVLVELNKQIQEARETRARVAAALTYPFILIVVAVISVTLMLRMVVPTFAKMFKDMDAELPDITKAVVDLSAFLGDNGLYLLGGIGGGVFLFYRFASGEYGRNLVSGLALSCPTVGTMMVQGAMYRFASNIALLLKSGIPMLEALRVLIGVFHTSPHYRRALEKASARVAAGRPLNTALEETGLFTALLTNTVRVGEESGELATVMAQVAPYYKEKMEATITSVTKLIEPVIIMGMGLTIATIMLAIYMPMFEMAGKVK